VLFGEVAEVTEEIVIDEEKEKAHKTRYISLYNQLFGWTHQKKSKRFYIPVIKV
jgi:hypothetical protein